MGNITKKHTGGFSAYKPTSGATHKEQKPGSADARPDAKMSWAGGKK